MVLLECPICEYLTLSKRAMYEICPVCGWEDEGNERYTDSSQPALGPNGELSIDEARREFQTLTRSTDTSGFQKVTDLTIDTAESMIEELTAILNETPNGYSKDRHDPDAETFFAQQKLLQMLHMRIRTLRKYR